MQKILFKELKHIDNSYIPCTNKNYVLILISQEIRIHLTILKFDVKDQNTELMASRLFNVTPYEIRFDEK